MQVHNHLLISAEFIPSPNFDERPPATPIDLIVIHGISLPPGEFGGHAIEQLFTNQLNINAHPYFASIQTLRVSSHLLIRRDAVLQQFVAFDKRAWHAGVSSFQGRENCNDYAIGIELEGTDDSPYLECQYQQLTQVIKVLLLTYPAITLARIVGHSDIAPGRKTDPGVHFDWRKLKNSLL